MCKINFEEGIFLKRSSVSGILRIPHRTQSFDEGHSEDHQVRDCWVSVYLLDNILLLALSEYV